MEPAAGVKLMLTHPNAPNALSVLRMALAPVLLLAILEGHPLAAAMIFAAGMSTDILDGHLARSGGHESNFGKLLDPAADKLLVGAGLVGLAATGAVWAWAVGAILGRELAVSLLRQWALRRGTVIAANRLGKAKTGLQAVMIFSLILAPDPTASLILALVLATVGVTILSGLSYLASYVSAPVVPAPRLGIPHRSTAP